MPIPKYSEMYKPFLECLKDGQPHTAKEINPIVATMLNISDNELLDILPSGKQGIFANRIGWARTYLKKAGVVYSPARGVFVLTEDGKNILAENPNVIDDQFLMRFENFRKFKTPNNTTLGEIFPTLTLDDTPQDIFDSAYKLITQSLADDVLSEIMKQSPAFFEDLVVKLLEKMGYGGKLKGAGSVTQQTNDEGIDGIIKEDKLGFNLIFIQAKRWDIEKTIGRPEIQKFVGALAGQGATKGLFITTANFTKEAIAYANKQHTTKVVLVDGEMLTKLMIEHNLGVSTEEVYEIKKIDTDFFNEDI